MLQTLWPIDVTEDLLSLLGNDKYGYFVDALSYVITSYSCLVHKVVTDGLLWGANNMKTSFYCKVSYGLEEINETEECASCKIKKEKKSIKILKNWVVRKIFK